MNSAAGNSSSGSINNNHHHPPADIDVEDWPECFGGDAVAEFRGGNFTLARGAFGEIALGIFRDSSNNKNAPPRWTAVKHLRHAATTKSSENFEESAGQQQRRLTPHVAGELHALQTLGPSHPNIVRLLALYYSNAPNGALALAFEYCPTDLDVTLQWRRRCLLPLLRVAPTVAAVAHDLLRALRHCHAHGIAHGDVKPGNLLVSSTGGVIRLCDFGLARRVQQWKDDGGGGGTETDPSNGAAATSATSFAVPRERGLCTLAYRPPEVILGGNNDEHAFAGDVWSAGVVLAELLTGRTLFTGTNDLSQLSQIWDCVGTPTELPSSAQLLSFTIQDPKAPRDLAQVLPRAAETPPLLELLRGCLARDPAARQTAGQLLEQQQAWFSSVLPSDNDSNSNNNHSAWRETLQEELIPPALDEPFLLMRDDDENISSSSSMAVVQRQALALAKTRRTFLRDLDQWQNR